MKWFVSYMIIFLGSTQMLRAQKTIDRYEYWYDFNHSARVITAVPPAEEYNLNTSFPVTSLPDGLHTFHIRFRDNSGKWSSALNRFFIKNPIQPVLNNKITAYRYWFDLNHSKVQVIPLGQPVNPYQLAGDIKVLNLPNGMHTFNIQFRDILGQWSSTLSSIFTVNLTAISDREMGEELFRVYPNPAKEKLFVSFDRPIDHNSRLVLRNISGQVIKSFKPENQKNDIDISNLPAGMYFIEWCRANSAESRKIVIQ